MYNLVKCSEEEIEKIRNEWFVYVPDIYIFTYDFHRVGGILVSDNPLIRFVTITNQLTVYNTQISRNYPDMASAIMAVTFEDERELYSDAVIAFPTEKDYIKWKLTH